MDPATIMAILGGLSGVAGSFMGSSGQSGSTYSKKQRGFIDDMLNQLQSMRSGASDITQNQNYQTGQDWLQSMFNDPEFFNRFEAPIKRDFQENTVPELANRFAGMGSGGALGSTAFRNQLAREGSNLSTNLAALRGGMQQQAIPQLMGYSQQPFQNYMQMLQSALTPTKNTYQGPSSGGLGSLAAPLLGGAASIWGQQAGQSAGAGSSSMPGMGSAAGSGAGWDAMFRQQGVM